MPERMCRHNRLCAPTPIVVHRPLPQTVATNGGPLPSIVGYFCKWVTPTFIWCNDTWVLSAADKCALSYISRIITRPAAGRIRARPR
eukprot:4591642-Prymnesium_polylepis.1